VFILRTVKCLTLTIVVLFSSVFVGHVFIGAAQGYEEVSGIITSDTTWTKANSPYNLTGNMAINEEVTLTIEPGVTVNLNQYYIRVNGTLTARGTSTDKIHLNDGYLDFTASSAGWNEQTGTGSIIENAIVNSIISTTEVSLIINNNTITKSLSLAGGSPIIAKNSIDIVTGSDWLGRPVCPSNAISISDVFYLSNENTAQVVDNTIVGDFDNAAIVVGNGSPTIERNIISNSYGYGGDPGYGQSGIIISGDAHPIIKQNTIKQCANGISISGSPTPTIVNNNIESITSFNLKMGSRTVNVDAADNWWGTTDTAEIDEKIWDYNDDFDLGKVNYLPFLTAANPQAVPDMDAPTPTLTPNPTLTPTPPPTGSPSTSPTPSQEPQQTGQFQAIGGIAIATVVIGAGLGLLIYLTKRT
jgi:parallel beta-helix repeat protein